MKMSQLFSQTMRENPAEAEIPSHQLLVRAGFIRQLAAGIFSYLPLARRSMNKIEGIIRQEMEAIGAQEITMPVIHPAELWKETGRWYQIDAEMGRFKDRGGRDMVLAMTHEEVVADLVRKEIRSYKQLPIILFHIQTKWRDDPRPRAGLIRVREFTMKDSYSLASSWEELDQQYQAHYEAYHKIFQRCGLKVHAVASDVGMMGGSQAHEYMFLSPYGEDTLLFCDTCGYAANRQVAGSYKSAPEPESLMPITKVATPGCKSIESLATFLNIPKSKTVKAVFMVAELMDESLVIDKENLNLPQVFVFAIVRGDMEVNETKLANIIKARSLRPATDDEIRSIGAEPGYASPFGLSLSTSNLPLFIVVDDLIPQSNNLVAGANEEGYHLLNVNYSRDFSATHTADITTAENNSLCPECHQPMKAFRGIEVGNIFKLGTRYTEALGGTFLDKDGSEKPVIMGSYGIGVGRLLACIAEAYHDDHGLCWPVAVAPFQVHLISLGSKKASNTQVSTTEEIAVNLYADLTKNGIEVLFDDRPESPGVKFNDADLLGLPIRITVGERSLKQGGVEFKLRTEEEKRIVPMGEAVQFLAEILMILQAKA
jgi:prolyl-tRNA synthetase